jgi:hypothetical protein
MERETMADLKQFEHEHKPKDMVLTDKVKAQFGEICRTQQQTVIILSQLLFVHADGTRFRVACRQCWLDVAMLCEDLSGMMKDMVKE